MQEIKERISYTFAAVALFVGLGLTIAGFCVSPIGVVDESVLWVLGQCLTFVGAVCGVALHVKNNMQSLKQEILDDLNKK